MQRLIPRASTRQLVLITIACVIAAAVAVSVFGSTVPAGASSHREAPFISTDPQADSTDVYAFVSPDNPETVTLIANYIPFQQPASGPTFFRFGEDVLYEIDVDNDGDAKPNLSFQFRFDERYTNPDTFLTLNTGPITSLDDPDLNRKEFYSVSVLEGEDAQNDPQRQGKVIADGLQVAPYNVGPASYPEGYGPVAEEAVNTLDNGMKVFAGPRDDPFFIDLGGAFDLLQFRALQGLQPVDDFSGLNVHSIALQVPKSMLRGPDSPVIGVVSDSYRQQTRVLQNLEPDGPPVAGPEEVAPSEGPFVRISRLDIPLVNEVLIALRDKDRWNNSDPTDDAQFLEYIQNPELGGLIEQVFGIEVPDAPREDLVTIFLTGIPDLNQPANVVPSSQLRLNMDTPPSASPSPLGVLGGDNAGFPNGRRLSDDVVDIASTAVAGGTPFTPEFNDEAHMLSDGVDSNDVPFLDTFPFVNVPHDYVGASYPQIDDALRGMDRIVMPETGGVPYTGDKPDAGADEPDKGEKSNAGADEPGKGGVLRGAWQKVTGLFTG
jgi:hypothetical protein